MATYNSGVLGVSFRVDCSNSIAGTYPDVKHRVSYTIYLQHADSENSTQYNGAVLNFGDNSHSVDINVSGAGEWALASGTIEYTFATNNREDSRDIYFSTNFKNVSASGSQTESAIIALPIINDTSLSSDYKSISYSASLTLNPNDFYAIRAVLGEDAKVGNNGGWTDLSPNTTYTVNFYVVYRGSQSTLLTDAVTESITTKKPDKPSTGTVAYTNLTPFGATFEWSGFSVSEGATIDHYEYSLDNSNWINVGTDTQIHLDNLSPETSYTLYVRIVDNFGSKSDSATSDFKTLVDQLKLAYNTNLYQTEILTKDGVDILAKNGDNLIVDTIGNERLRTAKVFYNDNGVIKKIKAVYYNKKGNIQHYKNYEK